MTHPLLRDLLAKSIASAISSASAVKDVSHPGLRGRAREIFVNELLMPLLLPGQIVGTGAVIDSLGNQSGQSDIVVFDKSILPPELFSENEGLFPIEACAYVIEVKSKLTSKELKDYIGKSGRLQSLQPLAGVFRPVPTIFAFQSDLSGTEMADELRRYAKLHSQEYPCARVICIANKGYAFFAEGEKQWKFMNSDTKFSNVANFLAGFANTLPDFRRLRNSTQIPYGYYMLDLLNYQNFNNDKKGHRTK